jgi:hypothetical protein
MEIYPKKTKFITFFKNAYILKFYRIFEKWKFTPKKRSLYVFKKMHTILKFIEFLKNGNLPQKKRSLSLFLKTYKIIIRKEILVIYYKIYQYNYKYFI